MALFFRMVCCELDVVSSPLLRFVNVVFSYKRVRVRVGAKWVRACVYACVGGCVLICFLLFFFFKHDFSQGVNQR